MIKMPYVPLEKKIILVKTYLWLMVFQLPGVPQKSSHLSVSQGTMGSSAGLPMEYLATSPKRSA